MNANVREEKTPQVSKEEILSYAREVFGDAQKTQSWLTTPNPVFNGMQPRDFIEIGDTEDRYSVFNELGRIDHGLF